MRTESTLPTISGLTLRFFTRVARRYFHKHFRSVMAQNLQELRHAQGPLIVYGNHSSWWDPLLMVLLAQTVLPGRRHYAPMDATALKQYPIFRRIGVFPVELATGRGAAMFLQTSTAILASGGVLWLTPQGRFVDPRVRPLAFKAGLGLLAARMPHVALLPLAVEYTFWDERLPETLLRFGPVSHVQPESSAEQATQQLEEALELEMTALQAVAIARNGAAFEPVLRGKRGTGGVYGFVRRVRALLTGRRFQADHTQR